MLYPPFKKLRSSVRPSVWLSGRQSIDFTLSWEHFLLIFFKLAMRDDTVKECPGMADG